ncbi:MAG: YkgJ family cysteine cluster protein [Nitrospirae bacterium]|nr:YkgJ family cysteine cluster protein [Nitrospirota bacterium]
MAMDSEFRFRCHPGISCFNKCCSKLDIFLSPYDIVRMKNRLNMTSGEFLLKYTDTIIPKDVVLPFVKLNMGKDGRCQFNTDAGCTIYTDRPSVCRYYPLGLGLVTRKNVGGDFYFLIREEHCKGFEEDKQWSVGQWRVDQGPDLYDDMNKDWMDLVLKKKRIGAGYEPDEKSFRMFFMACYDIDSFKSFVFESAFLDVFDLNEEEIHFIKTDEAELMKFAHRWLQFVLFKVPTMSLKKDAAKEKNAGDKGEGSSCGCSSCP